MLPEFAQHTRSAVHVTDIQMAHLLVAFVAMALGHGAAVPSLRRAAHVEASLTAAGCTPGNTSFDNLLLVEQWPGTIGVKSPGFTMHGLWPSRTGANVANYPCQCTNESFDVSLVASIMTPLNTYWPSAEGDNPTFWAHEYTKHGTCAEALPTLNSELAFFSGALSLRQNQNSIGLLAKVGITPSSTSTYEVAAVSAAFPHATILKCNSNNMLQEVATCFSKSLVAIDCEADTYGGTSCADGIRIPPVGSVPAPSAAPAPSTPGTQCVPDKHGPPCSSDGDCAGIPHCVRCAKSGFCTEQPAAEKGEEEEVHVGVGGVKVGMPVHLSW